MIMNELLAELEKAGTLKKLLIAVRNGLAFRKHTADLHQVNSRRTNRQLSVTRVSRLDALNQIDGGLQVAIHFPVACNKASSHLDYR